MHIKLLLTTLVHSEFLFLSLNTFTFHALQFYECYRKSSYYKMIKFRCNESGYSSCVRQCTFDFYDHHYKFRSQFDINNSLGKKKLQRITKTNNSFRTIAHNSFTILYFVCTKIKFWLLETHRLEMSEEFLITFLTHSWIFSSIPQELALWTSTQTNIN